MDASLKAAKSIVFSFAVDTKKHREFLSVHMDGGVSCRRNELVAAAAIAIDELAKSL